MSDAEMPNVLFFPPSGPQFRTFTLTNSVTIGPAVLRAGSRVTYDAIRNEFTLRGALEFDPWEPDTQTQTGDTDEQVPGEVAQR